ncbi:hypothetical protein ScalyP_jg9966 [Parmales sp. scaly parma]|nr:hypothetical protein ScalyP_jg9966 [Parmales sp. scaly parma]
MKLRQLESALSNLHASCAFEKPNIQLEQYHSTPSLTASVVFLALQNGDIEDKLVCDLGCGTGMLSIGSVVAGAAGVIGIDCDETAMSQARGNREEMEVEEELDFVFAKVNLEGEHDGLPFLDNSFDTVLTNPPFGTKHNAGIDVAFLKAGIRLASGSVYSFHKSATRDFLLKKCNEEWNKDSEKNGYVLRAEVAAEMKFVIPKSYKFHKKDEVEVEVDLICVMKDQLV